MEEKQKESVILTIRDSNLASFFVGQVSVLLSFECSFSLSLSLSSSPYLLTFLLSHRHSSNLLPSFLSSSVLPLLILPLTLSHLRVVWNNCSAAFYFPGFLSSFGRYQQTQRALTIPKSVCSHARRHAHTPTPTSVKVNALPLA